MKISQIFPGIIEKEYLYEEMIEIHRILEKNNILSNIYVESVPEKYSETINKISNFVDNNDILIVHHSLGHDFFNIISNYKGKKILFYHNDIAEKFIKDDYLLYLIRLGNKQLTQYRTIVDSVITNTNYERKKLLSYGYNNIIDVVPIRSSLKELENINVEEKLVNEYGNSVNIISVSDIVADKCILDVIKSFAVYCNSYNRNSKLFLITDVVDNNYLLQAKRLISEYNIEGNVLILNRTTKSELKPYYNIANVFLCMSENESLHTTLLDAMKMEVPIIAYNSSTVTETMYDSGVIIGEKDYSSIGALIDEIVNNIELKNRIIESQNSRYTKLKNIKYDEILMRAINNCIEPRKQSIQLQGSFETSYSLSIVNKELIEAINRTNQYDCSIHCTEGYGDYTPAEQNLEDKPVAKALWERSCDYVYPDIAIRNMYPPRVKDVNAGISLQFFGWEESYIPKEYVENFNRYLDGIGTMSDYVTNTLIENGVTIPVKTMKVGVNLPENYDTLDKFNLKTKKKIKFLHISSAFPRKGVDILLKAFYNSFDSNDDVCLVIKSFPNPHNNVQEILDSLARENAPEVEWIDEDLQKNDLYGLYKACDCYVQVARGEGFGLPIAEAMLAKMPVIVSANSGAADFCNSDTALLVDYKSSISKTHINKEGQQLSFSFEPSQKSLEERFREFYEGRDLNTREKRVKNAYELISTSFNWDKIALDWFYFIKEVEKEKFKPKVAMITTWNTKCGIAEFSKMMVNSSAKCIDYKIFSNYGDTLLQKDENYVMPRLWKSSPTQQDLYLLSKEINRCDCDIVNIQFSYSFFVLPELGRLIRSIRKKKKIVIEFHETKDITRFETKVSLSSISDELNSCDVLIVHQEEDKKELIEKGIKEELISIVPLGQLDTLNIPSEIQRTRNNIDSSHVIGSYGFLLPHKGIKKTIEAVNILKETYPDIKYLAVCSLYNSQSSIDYYDECIDYIKQNELEDNVVMINDYLSNEESLNYLQCCDLLIMPYLDTQQSASGAIRFCIAAKRPVITTDIPIFDEFKEYVYQIKESQPSMIADAVKEFYQDNKFNYYVEKDIEYINKTSWNVVGKKMYNIYLEILGNK